MKRRQILAAGGAGSLAALLAACGGGTDAGEASSDSSIERAIALAERSSTANVVAAVPNAVVDARVIVVGGGMAGTTVAKYLRLWSNGTIAVTLVEREARYTSSIMSSLVLTGQRTLGSLQFAYDTLRTRYGVTVVTGEVTFIDPVAARVRLAAGTQLQAERIVLAPGIAFDAVPGLTDPNLMPHAWQAGPQTTLLARQLSDMRAGGAVVMAIPKTPFRCPPGPYERSCLIADWLKANKPGSKLIVLDANANIIEKDNFLRAYTTLYPNIVQYRPNSEVLSVDSATKTLNTTLGPVRGDVVNLIPRQRAPALVAATGLVNSADGRFALVDVLSYASTAAPLVHVLGDSSSTTQPKAGHIANQEAKVCADALVRIFGGGPPDPAPVTNSACYSTITMGQASWLAAGYQYDPATRLMTSVPAAYGPSIGWSSDNFSEMGTWFNALMADTFA